MARILIASPSGGSKDNLPWEVSLLTPSVIQFFLALFCAQPA
jgi:hypothetical protein